MTEAEYKRRHAAAGEPTTAPTDPEVRWLYEHSVVAPAAPKLFADLDEGEELIRVGVQLETIPEGVEWFDPEWWVVMWRPDVPNSRFIDLKWARVENAVDQFIPIPGDAGWYFVGGTDNEGRWVTSKSEPFQIMFPSDRAERGAPPDARFFPEP